MDRRDDGVGGDGAEGSAEAVALTYTLGRDDFVGALRAWERRRGRRAFTCLNVVVAAAVVVLALTIVLRIAEDGVGAPGAAYFLLVALAFIPLAPAVGARLAGRGAIKGNAHLGELRATVSERGVWLRGGSIDSRTAWANYGSYMETEEAFVLRSPDGEGRMMTPLPKRGLADGRGGVAEGEAARLRVLLDRHLKRV